MKKQQDDSVTALIRSYVGGGEVSPEAIIEHLVRMIEVATGDEKRYREHQLAAVVAIRQEREG